MPPDFIGIGAQKSGTTWLDSMLRAHPDIWMPPIKEIHYFDRGSLVRKIRRDRVLQRSVHALLSGKFAEARWLFRYLAPFGTSDEWYQSLFDNTGSAVSCGEITPAYQTLSEEEVVHVQAVCPSAKILFLMRNPADRVYSAINMMYPRARLFDSADVDECRLLSYVKRPEVRDRTRYVETIDRWSRAFGADKLFIDTYDSIVDQPMILLERLCDFLEVRWSASYFEEGAGKVVNPGRGQSMSANVRSLILGEYRDEIEALSARFPATPVSRWLS